MAKTYVTHEQISGLPEALAGKSDVGHDHAGQFATVGHNHDATYSPIGHSHGSEYVTHGELPVVPKRVETLVFFFGGPLTARATGIQRVKGAHTVRRIWADCQPGNAPATATNFRLRKGGSSIGSVVTIPAGATQVDGADVNVAGVSDSRYDVNMGFVDATTPGQNWTVRVEIEYS